jgi:hypothetical protein
MAAVEELRELVARGLDVHEDRPDLYTDHSEEPR